jgi:hypothetical protein
VNAKDAAHRIPVDLDAEGQRHLLRNSKAAPIGITPFYVNDRINEIFVWSFPTGLTSALGRKQAAVLSFLQSVVEIQKSRRLQYDRGPEDACAPHQKCAQAGNNPIRRA